MGLQKKKGTSKRSGRSQVQGLIGEGAGTVNITESLAGLAIAAPDLENDRVGQIRERGLVDRIQERGEGGQDHGIVTEGVAEAETSGGSLGPGLPPPSGNDGQETIQGTVMILKAVP
jgi:hypothetical protein